MTIFRFETEAKPNTRLPSLGETKKLAVLIQTPSYIQEVLLSFGKIKRFEYEKNKEEKKKLTAYYKSKGGIIDWMQSNPVIIDGKEEVNGWNLFSSFREDSERLIIKRNEELFHFYDELYSVSKSYLNDLVFLPHKFSARLYSYWLIKGKPIKMELYLPDFHSIFQINEKNYYSYSHVEDRILFRVKEMFESVGYKIKYQKNQGRKNYTSSESIFIEKI